MMEKKTYIDLKVSTKIIRIPVDPVLYERYLLQFCRNKPSTAQRGIFWTLKALMRDAISERGSGQNECQVMC